MNKATRLTIGDGVKGAGAPTPSVEDSLCGKLLPFMLSVAAGSMDIIGFLRLGGLFTAHVTGNVVVLAAKLGAREEAPLAYLISVPVFVAVLCANHTTGCRPGAAPNTHPVASASPSVPPAVSLFRYFLCSW
jgi:hypothetical protein